MVISTCLTYDTVPETTFQPIGAPHAPPCYRVYSNTLYATGRAELIQSVSVSQSQVAIHTRR